MRCVCCVICYYLFICGFCVLCVFVLRCCLLAFVVVVHAIENTGRLSESDIKAVARPGLFAVAGVVNRQWGARPCGACWGRPSVIGLGFRVCRVSRVCRVYRCFDTVEFVG